jgi:transposase-like protein
MFLFQLNKDREMRRKACPKCDSREYVKIGFFANGKQRLRCKACRHAFVEIETKTYPQEKRDLAKKLYLEGLGFRAIGRIIGVSNVTVLNWIRDMGEALLNKTVSTSQAEQIELDELCTYIQKKTKNVGYGLLLTVQPETSLPAGSVLVVSKTPGN